MIPTFEDALMELIDKYRSIETLDEIISAMELRIYALKEEERDEDKPA